MTKTRAVMLGLFRNLRYGWTTLAILLFCASFAMAQEWVYTVKPGDNLWSLGKEHLVSMRYWKEFQELNKIQDPMHIPPGSTIRFPVAWLKAGATVARVVQISGSATIIESGSSDEKEAQKGMFLWANDAIRTGAGSNVTIGFSDGSQVLVQENSELLVEKLMSFGSTGMAQSNVRLQSGRVHNTIIPKAGPASRFEISTPSAIAAVRGTEYRISADANGESKAEVLKGEVAVDSAGAALNVQAGFGTISYIDRQPLAPVRLIDPPDLSEVPPVITMVPYRIAVKPLDGALLYRMQISRSEKFDSLLFDSTFSSATLWIPDLPDGSYHLRIHGIDKLGLEGMDGTLAFLMDAHPIPPLLVNPAPQASVHEEKPTFQWSEPQNISGYVFQLARDEGFQELLVDERAYPKTALALTSAIDPGVYYWRVAAIDQSGKTGPYSDGQLFRRTPPSPDMSDAELDTGSMVFRWRTAGPGQKYKCQVSRDKEFQSLAADEVVAEPQFSLKQLHSGQYYVRVAVVDQDGYAGPFSPYQTVNVPPSPPPVWAYLIPVVSLLVFLL